MPHLYVLPLTSFTSHMRAPRHAHLMLCKGKRLLTARSNMPLGMDIIHPAMAWHARCAV